MSLDLGGRADTFTANLNDRTVAPESTLIIQSFGQGGGDHLTLNANNVSVGLNAFLTVDLQGGKAKDVLSVNYTPNVIEGIVTIIADQRTPR